MSTMVYFLIATAVALLAVRTVRAHHALVEARPAPHGPQARPRPVSAGHAAAAPPIDALPTLPQLEGDALRSRLRDRYIAARFPGIARGAEDLRQVDVVIRSARLCFEEENSDQAQELLQMAIEQSPGEESLRLAQLEIAFLLRDRPHFVALAQEFRRTLPQSRNWGEVARLGRALAPEQPDFAAGPGARPHEHYGPWPDLPNWIQAPWDLTAEVRAADFRRSVLRSIPSQTVSYPHRYGPGA